MFWDIALESFYLFGTFQGIVIVILLTARNRTRANNILAILIALLSLFLLEQVMFLNSGIRAYPHIFYSTLPFTFLIGPAIYHFVRTNTQGNPKWKWIHLTHLVPFIYELGILVPFYILPAETKIAIYEYSIQFSGTLQFDQFSFGYLVYICSTLYFLIRSFRLLRSVSSQKKRDQFKKKLLLRIVSVIAVYLALTLVLFVMTFIFLDVTQFYQVSPLLLCLLIHIMGFICFLNPDVITSERNTAKYVNSGLSNQQVELLGRSLVAALEEKRLYLNPELTPKELADELGISTTDLSRVLSEGLNSNFYELVNKHRVDKAKSLLSSKDYSNAKLLHIALDSGYSNKTSLVRNFKRFVGMNPSDFRKKGHHSIEWIGRN